MQLWMLAGFEIVKALEPIAPVIEVFPQATIRRLLPNAQHKLDSDAAEIQLQALAAQTGWPTTLGDSAKLSSICLGAMHDKVDAYSAAWIASLSEEQRECYGEGRDAIWVPKFDTLKPLPSSLLKLDIAAKPPKRRDKKSKLQQNEQDDRKVCPACNEFTFKRWPFGWDAHAAHRCAGLPKGEPEARKPMFIAKYL